VEEKWLEIIVNSRKANFFKEYKCIISTD